MTGIIRFQVILCCMLRHQMNDEHLRFIVAEYNYKADVSEFFIVDF